MRKSFLSFFLKLCCHEKLSSLLPEGCVREAKQSSIAYTYCDLDSMMMESSIARKHSLIGKIVYLANATSKPPTCFNLFRQREILFNLVESFISLKDYALKVETNLDRIVVHVSYFPFPLRSEAIFQINSPATLAASQTHVLAVNSCDS